MREIVEGGGGGGEKKKVPVYCVNCQRLYQGSGVGNGGYGWCCRGSDDAAGNLMTHAIMDERTARGDRDWTKKEHGTRRATQ